MKRTSLLISRYLLTSILPYFASSWLLLTVILFIQQAARYSDIFFGIDIPASLAWQLTLALIPNVIAFTCPMAILVGTIIGLTKMQGDSELVAIRASGVGNFQIALPIMLLGLVLSGFAFLVNLEGVPLAAGLVRNVALQGALKKLESPIEPGSFNSEVAGYTIHVKEGDIETGRWRKIFIYSEDKARQVIRLITSSEGRIDTAGAESELVLENASITTLPMAPGTQKYVSENLGGVRFAIRTPRSAILDRITNQQLSPEELGLQQLSDYASTLEGRARVEAQLVQSRRLLLSITPLIFCLLGTVIVLRLNRGGRNFGIALALAVLVLYYLLAFLGEQMARTGSVNVITAGLIPIVGSLIAIASFALSPRFNLWTGALTGWTVELNHLIPRRSRWTSNLFVDLTTGLRDFDLVRNLVKFFLLAVIFLALMFQIFTGFDLWKFAGAFEGGPALLAKYLLYLLPLVYLQVSPPAAMIAVLATYAIKSRQNEIVTWTSAGQSIYRLLMPCFLLMLVLGGINWVVQEQLLPTGNRRQDSIRLLIRARGEQPKPAGKSWVASGPRIYSFNPPAPGVQTPVREMSDVSVFEFAANGTTIKTVFRAPSAFWNGTDVVLTGNVERTDGQVRSYPENEIRIQEPADPFAETQERPSEITTAKLKDRIAATESDAERRDLEVGLHRRYTTLFLPLVIALFTAPLAISLSRQGKASSVAAAVGLWLVFTGLSSVGVQLASNGLISPVLAVWSPIVLFALVGAYLVSRVRT